MSSLGIGNIGVAAVIIGAMEFLLFSTMNKRYYQWLCHEGLPSETFSKTPPTGRVVRWAWIQEFEEGLLLAKARWSGFTRNEGFSALLAEYELIEGVYWRSIRIGRPGRMTTLCSAVLAPLLELAQHGFDPLDLFLCFAVPGAVYTISTHATTRADRFINEAEGGGKDIFSAGDPSRGEQRD
jgi:hypothetical protein